MTALIVLGCIVAGIIALYLVVALVIMVIGAIVVAVQARRASKASKAFRAKVYGQGAPFRTMETRIRPRNLHVSI